MLVKAAAPSRKSAFSKMRKVRVLAGLAKLDQFEMFVRVEDGSTYRVDVVKEISVADGQAHIFWSSPVTFDLELSALIIVDDDGFIIKEEPRAAQLRAGDTLKLSYSVEC